MRPIGDQKHKGSRKPPIMERSFSFVPALSMLQVLIIVVVVGFFLQQAVGGATTVVNEDKNLLNVTRLEMFVDDLPDMPRVQGFGMADGVLVPGNLTIGMYEKFWKFHRDLPPTRVLAYGVSNAEATVPGPTIEAIQGIPTYVTWTNHLLSRHILPWDPTLLPPNTSHISGVRTVVHLHGGVHPPTSDGNSLAWFTAGFRSVGPAFAGPTSFYPNLQPPGNLWYHDHAMGLTRVNILAGLVGAYVLRSPIVESPLRLPEGPEFDRHLVLFDRAFRLDGSLYMNATGDNCTVHPQWQPEYFGDSIVVNGKAWPRLHVRRRRYRFRIINASNARFFRLYFKDDPQLHFIHIGSDSNYLKRPVRSKQFLLAPSEIADVVVDFADSRAEAAILANDAPYPFPSGDPTNEANGNVMKFVIERRRKTEPDPSHVPMRLLRYPVAVANRAKVVRYIAMYEYTDDNDDPTKLLLNALPYEAPATEVAEEGSVEVWNVINLTDDNHPIHIHLAAFKVLEQRGLVDIDEFKACMQEKNDAVACHVEEYAKGKTFEVPPYEQGWKNVFKMHNGNVTRILVRFAPLQGGSYAFDPTAEPGYVYHCHILDHEDNAMMRPLKIVSRR